MKLLFIFAGNIRWWEKVLLTKYIHWPRDKDSK